MGTNSGAFAQSPGDAFQSVLLLSTTRCQKRDLEKSKNVEVKKKQTKNRQNFGKGHKNQLLEQLTDLVKKEYRNESK